jgi:hypothetical protein
MVARQVSNGITQASNNWDLGFALLPRWLSRTKQVVSYLRSPDLRPWRQQCCLREYRSHPKGKILPT